jgi:hypothetical protein
VADALDHDIRIRLAKLEDRQSIADLIADYCRGVDRCDDALLRSTYWPDAVDNHGVSDSPAMAFCDRVIPILKETCLATMHLVANSRVELAGDEAFGETYVVAYHVLKAAAHLDRFMGEEPAQAVRAAFAETPADAPFAYNAGARFLDRFERRGGEWRVAARTVVYDWMRQTPLPDDQAPATFGLRQPTGGRKPDDPIYALIAGLGA